MDAYRDEIFGPVLTVVRVDTYEDALQLVNDNPYGNGTAIFTRDGGAARQFQFDANVGMVGINVPVPVPVAYYSFGGWKASLFGDLHMYGPEGIQFYSRARSSPRAGRTRAPPRSTSASRGRGRLAGQPQPSKRANCSNGTQPRFRLGDRTSGSGRPTGITPIGANSSGIPSSARSGSRSVPDEPAAEPFVDRREHHVLHRGADVDPPVGDRPLDLRPVREQLVGLLVAAVIDLLGHARDELRGALADPRAEDVEVVVLAAGLSRRPCAAPDPPRPRAAGPG